MIRINLLGVKKEIKKTSTAPAVSLEGAKIIVFLLVFLAIGLAWCGYRYMNLSKDHDDIAAAMKKEQDEKKRLEGVKTSLNAMQAQKARLEQQINVILALENGRTGPVQMMTTLANTVIGTKTMWLLTFDNTGTRLQMTGIATSAEAVATFLKNLRDTGTFANVDLKETAEDDKDKNFPVFNWEISMDYTGSGAPPPAPKK